VKGKIREVVKESGDKEDSLFGKIKSQAAMEYLMTYGWAILIIALSLAVLYSLGVLNPETLKPQLCSLSPPFYCSDQYLDTNGFLTLTIAQGSGSDIRINKIVCVDKSLLNQNGLPSNPSYWSNVGVSIPSGSQRQISNIICYSRDGKQYNGKIGSVFFGAIVINATTSTGANVFSVGEIGAPVKALSALTVTSTSISVYTTSTSTTSTISTSTSTSTATLTSTSTSTFTSSTSTSISTSTSTTSTSTSIIWLSGWTYRKPIIINNTNNANTLSNYQVLVTLDTASLISAGKIRSDCGDIRFTDSDAQTLLSYWIESGCNSANTKIWVKVPSIPASSTKTIYVYYGNSGATSTSNFDGTFVKANIQNGDISSGSDTSSGVCPSSTTITGWTNYCRSDYTGGEGPEKRDDSNSIPGHDGYAYMAASGWNYRGMYQVINIAGYVPFKFSFYGRSAPTSLNSCGPCGLSASYSCGSSTLSLFYLDSAGNTLGETMFWWYFYGLSSSQITTSCGKLNYQLTGGDSWTSYQYTGDANLISSSINKQNIAQIKIQTNIYTGSGTVATQAFDDFVLYLRAYSSPEPTASVGAEQSI
jgi:hypothetical protein